MPTEFLTQAQQAWEAADTLYKRSEGAERADAHQFWLEQAQKKQSQAQALALLAIAADLNQGIIAWRMYEMAGEPSPTITTNPSTRVARSSRPATARTPFSGACSRPAPTLKNSPCTQATRMPLATRQLDTE